MFKGKVRGRLVGLAYILGISGFALIIPSLYRLVAYNEIEFLILFKVASAEEIVVVRILIVLRHIIETINCAIGRTAELIANVCSFNYLKIPVLRNTCIIGHYHKAIVAVAIFYLPRVLGVTKRFLNC